ncbi:MFS transporter [Amycolatopsis pithecellobii]|uniref:MFS transporter n=1 Tax=Amycolatopsis pithecellobii TaxID=664692 RepID=A0A6N7YQN9_9PSEU|nr:MFS transporter [Amycolatopsis pithecellobii]MTD54302.1 MFS transporter [Amycolatopsis pithecellobii]
MSVRDAIDRAGMSRFQVTVVVLCLVINLVEGFDVLVMSFAAPGVAHDWGLSDSQVGVLLSSGLVGMAVGSAVLAPLADRIGRRPLTLICLIMCSAGMTVAGFSDGFAMLVGSRLWTGLGIGGMVAGLPVVITEYSPRRLRGTMIALYGTGLPVGGVLGGAVAALVVDQYGWRGTFFVGAVLSSVMVLAVAVAMPESLDYLISRRPQGALRKVNALLARMRLAGIDTLPEPDPSEARVRVTTLLTRDAVRTALLWLSYFVMMAGFYFAASWTPLLLQQSGFSAGEGTNAGLLLNLGGMAGTLMFSALALKVSLRVLTVLCFLAAGVSFLAMSLFLGAVAAALAAAVAVGMFINASGNGLNALAPGMYPTSVRATGVGWALAVGRVGALTAPALAGVLLDHSWSPRSLFGLLVVPLVVAAVAAFAATTSRRPSRSATKTGEPVALP